MNETIGIPRLAVSPDFALSVKMGRLPGYSVVSKFGENPDVDTGTTPEEVWEGGGEYVYDADGTAPIAYMSSSDNADADKIITIQGLDINGALVTQNITCAGQTVANLTTPLWRVWRAFNASGDGEDLAGTLYIHIDAAPTAGVPGAGEARAIIDNGNNQTLMALYTLPAATVGFLYAGEVGLSRGQAAGAARISYCTRQLGKVCRVQKRVDIQVAGSSTYQYYNPFPQTIPALTDLKVTVESVTANNMGVFAAFEILQVSEDQFSTEFLTSIGQPGY